MFQCSIAAFMFRPFSSGSPSSQSHVGPFAKHDLHRIITSSKLCSPSQVSRSVLPQNGQGSRLSISNPFSVITTPPTRRSRRRPQSWLRWRPAVSVHWSLRFSFRGGAAPHLYVRGVHLTKSPRRLRIDMPSRFKSCGKRVSGILCKRGLR